LWLAGKENLSGEVNLTMKQGLSRQAEGMSGITEMVNDPWV
jgi:hypothetical protein